MSKKRSKSKKNGAESSTQQPDAALVLSQWSGLNEEQQRRLELYLCRVELRRRIYAELPGKTGVTNFIGRVIGKAIEYMQSNLVAGKFPFRQRDLTKHFGLSSKGETALSKFLAGKQDGGTKKGHSKREWIEKGREGLSYLMAACEPSDLPNESPAKRVDHYFFRKDGEVVIWNDDRRGSSDCWSRTEFIGEIYRTARTRQLDSGVPAVIWFVSGGPPYFGTDHSDDPLRQAATECFQAGVELRFAYPKSQESAVDAERNVAAFRDRLGPQEAPEAHVIHELPITGQELSPLGFLNPVIQYVFLDIPGEKCLWIFRPAPGEDERSVREQPLALRGREKERQAFEAWIEQLRSSNRWIRWVLTERGWEGGPSPSLPPSNSLDVNERSQVHDRKNDSQEKA